MSKDNNKKRLNIRKSGLKKYREEAVDVEKELVGEKAISEFDKEYTKILKRYSKSIKDAYVIRFLDEPEAFFITFQNLKDRDTGKWEACKYFDSIHHPRIGLGSYSKARRKRIPEFDKYRSMEKVPIEEIMKLGAAYHCGLCGKHSFKYEDIINNRCFVVRDEGDINKFTSGFVICNECRRKHFS